MYIPYLCLLYRHFSNMLFLYVYVVEWGYWLSDVVTARASWDPLLSEPMQQLHHYYEQHGHPTSISEQTTNTTTTTDNLAYCSSKDTNDDTNCSCRAATSDELNTLLATAQAYNEREDE